MLRLPMNGGASRLFQTFWNLTLCQPLGGTARLLILATHEREQGGHSTSMGIDLVVTTKLPRQLRVLQVYLLLHQLLRQLPHQRVCKVNTLVQTSVNRVRLGHTGQPQRIIQAHLTGGIQIQNALRFSRAPIHTHTGMAQVGPPEAPAKFALSEQKSSRLALGTQFAKQSRAAPAKRSASANAALVQLARTKIWMCTSSQCARIFKHAL